MTLDSSIAFLAALFSAALAAAVLSRKRRSVAAWCFSAGMLVFALESLLAGMSLGAVLPDDIAFWQTLGFLAKSFLPGIWLCFSLTYSRANRRDFVVRSWFLLVAAFLIPLCLLPALYGPFLYVHAITPSAQGWSIQFGETAKILNGLILVSTILILTNLERTFRSAVGTMRWRIKFLVLGLGVIFGTRIYTRSQSLLFSGYNLGQLDLETAALVIGCGLIAIGYFRSGFGEVDVYPSSAVLHTSVTVLLAGAYLFVVGVLAKVVARFGGAGSFQIAAFLVLLGAALLAVLLLSDRLRQNIQLFVSRHFKRPQHDFRLVWTRFTRRIAPIVDEPGLCLVTSRFIAETFNALSVSVWLFDEHRQRLVQKSSTADSDRESGGLGSNELGESQELDPEALSELLGPFDLDKAGQGCPKNLKEIGGGQFRTGGNRICVPLLTGECPLGVIILADRVGGIRYTGEEMDLLKCIGDQVAASLLNLRLSRELMEKKELEAFQTISAFFVHDLKNAASTLGLTLQNLPKHFDDPEFRQDTLRGIGSAADRINQIVSRLNAFRHELHLTSGDVDLNRLVTGAVDSLNGTMGAEVVTQMQPVSMIAGDDDKLQSVVTNLLLNARDAAGDRGRITVATSQHKNCVVLSVSDNGCGMSPDFIRDSLFRPFRTTKKKGLGIGMFQAKMIVDAHRGSIQVESEVGVGTTFRVTLPIMTTTRPQTTDYKTAG